MMQTDLKSVNDQMRKLVSYQFFTLILLFVKSSFACCIIILCSDKKICLIFISAESKHEQQISNLKSSISNLQSAQDLLKERVDVQDTLNTNVRVLLAHLNSFDVMNTVTYYSANDIISSAAESRAIRLANKTPERSKLIGIDHSAPS